MAKLKVSKAFYASISSNWAFSQDHVLALGPQSTSSLQSTRLEDWRGRAPGLSDWELWRVLAPPENGLNEASYGARPDFKARL